MVEQLLQEQNHLKVKIHQQEKMLEGHLQSRNESQGQLSSDRNSLQS